MTNGTTIISGGTALVKPTAATTTKATGTTAGGGSIALAGPGNPHAMEDVVLMNEEERILPIHDEEITSEEEGGDDDDEGGTSAASKMERKILTVALVKSVVDKGKSPALGKATAPPGVTASAAAAAGGPGTAISVASTLGPSRSTSGDGSVGDTTSSGPESPRYGLRKRRRPAGEDLKRLEHNQVTNNGGLKRTSSPLLTSGTANPSGVPSKKPARVAVGTAKSAPARPKPAASISSKSTSATKPSSRARPVPSPSTIAGAPLPNSSFVPNPLAFKPTDATSTVATGTTTTTGTANVAMSAPSSVPCPLMNSAEAAALAAAVPPPRAPIAAPVAAPAAPAHVPVVAPAPAQQPVVDVTKSEPGLPIEGSTDKRRVTIQESSTRGRGFSIDLDSVGLDILPDEASGTSGGRNRAFSFECFAFGINADEPLPPLGSGSNPVGNAATIDLSSITGRPRGDSIIFDPSSFQDGGIHEQHALERATGASVTLPTTTRTPPVEGVVPAAAKSGGPILAHPGQPALKHTAQRPEVVGSLPPPMTTAAVVPRLLNHNDATVPSNVTSGDGQLPPVSSYTATTTTTTMATTTTTVTTTTTTTTATNSSSTFSMELLNKDGRIGIYLPDARRARIARFHAKRANRVWRKRIKYDCRKKLADSRPRIKGRFVKRSDV